MYMYMCVYYKEAPLCNGIACLLSPTLSLSTPLSPSIHILYPSYHQVSATVYLHCMTESLWKNRIHIMYTFIRHLTCDTGNLAPKLQPGHHWACK